MSDFSCYLVSGCGIVLSSGLILWGSSQLDVSHLWAVLIALIIILCNLLPTRDEFVRNIRSSADYLWPVEAVAPTVMPSIPIAQQLGPMYVPAARRLSPGYLETSIISYNEWNPAISPSLLCSVLLFEPVHVWSLSPLYPHIAPLAQSPLTCSVKAEQSLVNYMDWCPLQTNRCQRAPMLVGYLEASLLDRLNFDIPSLLCNCTIPPRASSNNVREPLRGDLLALRLLLKMKVGSQPTIRP